MPGRRFETALLGSGQENDAGVDVQEDPRRPGGLVEGVLRSLAGENAFEI
jgi:hypothetical protein